MSVPAVPAIRAYIRETCPRPGNQVSYSDLYQVFGLKTEKEKGRLRSKLKDMIVRGELIRVRPGVFTYHPKAVNQREGQGYQRVWRALRSARPGWTMQEIAQVTRMSPSMVRKYGNWLHGEGYIAHHGRRGNTRLYRATAKAKDRRETPYPPRSIKDPFAGERSAACRLVRLFMARDLARPAVRRRIVEECRLILQRFEKEELRDR